MCQKKDLQITLLAPKSKNKKANLDILADEALKQIDEKKYDTELLASGISNIVKIGIAFQGKKAVVKSK